ncbi:MAG TPA: amino acid adenylation domain-containing protein [Pyrinomonadaceae bacterium]
MSNSTNQIASLSPQEKRALLAQLLRGKGGERPAAHPLSHGQQALWFLHQLAPESAAYNVFLAMSVLSADLDVPALGRAFDALARRHPSLRTTFHTRHGKPTQTVHEHPEPFFEVVDASHWSDDQLDRRLGEEAHRSFDLERGPLMRVHLFRRTAEESVLLVTLHHIIHDFWSLVILMGELGALYPSERAGVESLLPPPRARYTDFVRWQSGLLSGTEGERLWSYWRDQLAGELPLLNLPTDRARPPVQTNRGSSHVFRLDEELTRGLKRLARAHGATLYMVLLAGLQTLLHRYTDQPDILVGALAAGRDRAEFENVVGYFVNPLVLRASFDDDPTFADFLRRVSRTVLDAVEHQDYPFPLLVERLQPARDPSRSPLIEVAFVLEKPHRQEVRDISLFVVGEPGAEADLGGLKVRPYPVKENVTQFDLELRMVEVGDTLSASLLYNTDLFDTATIRRLASHFQTLLRAAVADPARAVSTLPLLDEDERRVILDRSTLVQADHGEPRCLHRLFAEQAARTPELVAVACEDEQLTYAELNERADHLARLLRSKGVGPEVVVGLLLERSVEMVVSILAVIKAGGAYLPLDPQYPSDRLAFMLEDSAVPLLLTQQRLQTHLPEQASAKGFEVILVDEDEVTKEFGYASTQAVDTCDGGVAPDNLAYVIYTSGSTGKPKGTGISHANVARLFAATQDWFDFDERDVWTLFHSYAFDFSVWELWGALLYGGRLVVVPYMVSRSPESFRALLARERVSVLNQTPSAFRQLVGHELTLREAPALSLRVVIFGGEALELQSLRPWFERHGDERPQLVNMYGITETCVHVTYRPLKLRDLEETQGSCIGVPIPDLEIFLLDRHMQPVADGLPGEIYVGGAGLARGYVRRPGLTAQRFVPHPFGTRPGERLYKSGDLARHTACGELEYLGRIDQQVKVRGFRIELGEIEAALCEHARVRECVVVPRDEGGDKRLVAYVVTEEGETRVGELRDYLKERLPVYMVPSSFVLMERLPLTANGKVDRRALPAPAREGGEDEAYVAPRTPSEETLAAIWSGVLGVERVGAGDNFFELGGHSILATQVVSRVREAFQTELPLHSIFEAPTVRDLSIAVARKRAEAASEVEVNHLLCELERLTEEEAASLLALDIARAVGTDEKGDGNGTW